MADQTSTVIIDVNIKQEDALSMAKALNDQIVVLRDNQDKLKASGQQLSVGYKENAAEIRKLESETKAYIALSKNEEGSINSLRGQITLLTNQYNALSKAERENTTQGQALQKQLKSLNEEERKASQSAGNFKTSVGSYTEALRGATQNMLPFGSETARAFASVNSLAGAFKGVTSSIEIFKTALLTTGIGALVVALGSVISYLKDLDAVADTASQAMTGFKAVINELGRSLINLDFKGLINRMVQVGTQASIIAGIQQDLDDKVLAQSVKTTDAMAKIAELRVKAMNRSLDPEERKKLLAQAEQLDAQDLSARKKHADEQVKIIEASIALSGNLTKKQADDLRKRGVEAALDLQNNLVKQGKVTDEQTKALAKALQDRTQIQNEYTQRSEKRANLEDKISAQQQKAEEKRAADLQKIEEDRQQSLIYSSKNILTIRQKELADINLDINKRITMYQKYNQDTVQLEVERQARLKQLADKFRKEDLAIIQANLRESTLTQAKNGSTSFGGAGKQESVSAFQNLFAIQDVDKQMQDVKDRMNAGERGLDELLQSYILKRQTLIQDGLAMEQQYRDEAVSIRKQQQADVAQWEIDQDYKVLQNFIESNDAKMMMNNELLGSYQALFGTISQLAGENSVVAKIAFGLEKAFIIGQIIMNAELEKSNIRAAAAQQAKYAAAIPFVGIGLAAAILAVAEAQVAAITTREVISSGIVAAQAISEIAFAKGGFVQGPGSGTSDSIPARLSNGESVINAKSTKMFAPLLSDINVAGGGVAFANGGMAGSYVPSLAQQINNNNAVARSITTSIRGQKNVVYVESIVDSLDRNTVTVENANF